MVLVPCYEYNVLLRKMLKCLIFLQSTAISLTSHRDETAFLNEWLDDSRCAFVSQD